MSQSNADFFAAVQSDVVYPVKLVRMFNIPPKVSGAAVTSLYLCDMKYNVTWFDENGQSCNYIGIGMKVGEVERTKEQEAGQCHIQIDNVPGDFTSLASAYKLNGVRMEVYNGDARTLDSTSGATLEFSGRIRQCTLSATQIDVLVSNGWDDMDNVPRRLCWATLFPYIPSMRDPRELVTK